jgi:hypothetical protein
MLTATALIRPYQEPAPVAALDDDMPTRYFTLGGSVWGKTASGLIVDFYGTPAPPADQPAMLAAIDGFMARL